MSMVTSCPGCTTTFRITPEQLKLREGRVRCGKCRQVFDAFKTLASLPDDVPASAGAVPGWPGGSPVEPASAGPAFEAPGALPLQGALDIGPLTSGGATSPAFPAAGAKRWPWILVIVVLAIALAAQLVYLLRDRIAASWPAARPALERLCAGLDCTVALPRLTEQLAIESSDLQADPGRPNTVILTAALRNRGNAVVAHPALELTLTNEENQPIAKRVFQPADYLDEPSAAARGMAGMSEVSVRIALDTAELKPAGYRLFLFHP
jgi:predicted Zn finger-like uncharacterized protein